MAEELKVNVVEEEVGGANKFYITFMSQEIVMEYGLPSPLVLGVIDKPMTGETLNETINRSFKINVMFKEMLRGFCEELASLHLVFQKQAKRQSEEWIYLIDQRTSNASGEVPSYDIIGGFEVKAGVILGYKANPNYAVHTKNGFINFGKEINEKFYEYMLSLVRKKKPTGRSTVIDEK